MVQNQDQYMTAIEKKKKQKSNLQFESNKNRMHKMIYFHK